jgi:predicted phage-related endonuclease
MLDTAPHITLFPDLLQGSDEWLEARRGILTASEMTMILTPTLKLANNEKTRAHAWELAAQRITGHVEPRYIGDDMLRGHEDEVYARMAYDKHVAPTQTMGFMVNRKFGFAIGFSPDWLVGDDGLGEAKSRAQKYQVQTIAECVPDQTIPEEFVLQVQTGLLVSERKWLDFCSYSNGMHMPVIRAYPDAEIQARIIEAATAFERQVQDRIADYHRALASGARLIPTERRVVQEMF